MQRQRQGGTPRCSGAGMAADVRSPGGTQRAAVVMAPGMVGGADDDPGLLMFAELQLEPDCELLLPVAAAHVVNAGGRGASALPETVAEGCEDEDEDGEADFGVEHLASPGGRRHSVAGPCSPMAAPGPWRVASMDRHGQSGSPTAASTSRPAALSDTGAAPLLSRVSLRVAPEAAANADAPPFRAVGWGPSPTEGGRHGRLPTLPTGPGAGAGQQCSDADDGLQLPAHAADSSFMWALQRDVEPTGGRGVGPTRRA